jgi:recombination protein RecR
MNRYPSKLLEEAVAEFAKLPGIGEKTALRLVLHLLRKNKDEVNTFGNAIIKLRNEIRHCAECHNISETAKCSICSDPYRDHSLVCVVENIRDVMSIENTGQFSGVYHVLGGLISPMDGIAPGDLEISSLEGRVKQGEIKEIILALSTTMEGDTTSFYIYKRLVNYPISLTSIAKGIAIGDELEYADEVTLGQSIKNRVNFNPSVNK